MHQAIQQWGKELDQLMGKMSDEHLKKQLLRHESMRLKPYQDTAGHLTIGVGRNLDARGISKTEAMILLDADVQVARHDIEAICDHYGVSRWRLNSARQDALANLAFNVGRASLMGFRRMWAAIKIGDWDRAADELLDSRYALEVGHRAVELAEQLRTGVHRG